MSFAYNREFSHVEFVPDFSFDSPSRDAGHCKEAEAPPNRTEDHGKSLLEQEMHEMSKTMCRASRGILALPASDGTVFRLFRAAGDHAIK